MRVLVASAEALPYYKTGGLADVARALPDALVAHGHDVRVIMPAYAFIAPAAAPAGEDAELSLPWPTGSVTVRISVVQDDPDASATAFVHAPGFFDTDRPYDGRPGDPLSLARRFGFFCRAVVAYANHWGADVVHLNDWPTGMVPAYALVDGMRAASVFAIHNLAYQGNFPAVVLPEIGIPAGLFRTENGVEFHGQASFVKTGISLADRLVTVSPTYAREIQSAGFGNGLDGLLRFRRRLLHGVLNGIDTAHWNPATDALVPLTYNARTLTRKNASRNRLLELAGIAGDGPILGIVSRLAQQKGIDLLLGAIPEFLRMGCRLIVLGSGEPAYEHAIASFARSNPTRIALHSAFDEGLAHLIYAGADYFGMPSLYEPCGLGQMIAQRYGTPPIARRTGGLNDTIEHGVSGFLFEEPSAHAFAQAVQEALAGWERRGWRSLQAHCMGRDHSWTRSATEYERIYQWAIGAG